MCALAIASPFKVNDLNERHAMNAFLSLKVNSTTATVQHFSAREQIHDASITLLLENQQQLREKGVDRLTNNMHLVHHQPWKKS